MQLKKKALSLAIGMSLMGVGEIGYSFDPKPFLGGIDDAISESLEEPEKSVFGIGRGLINAFIPTPDIDQEILNQLLQISSQLTQISAQLNILEQQSLEILQVDEETIKLISAEENKNDLAALIKAINDTIGSASISGIQSLYSDLNTNFSIEQPAVLPIQGDLYDFAVKQCPSVTKPCSPLGQSVYDTLFDDSNSDSTLHNYQNNFIDTLTGSSFSSINTAYANYLDKGEFSVPNLSGNYVAQYLNATMPIQEATMTFYQALGLMYNMQAIQLAFHYANPMKFHKTKAFISKVGAMEILSPKTGRDGYEESMQLLSSAYAKTFLSDSSSSPSIPKAFGGKTYTYSDSNNTLTSDATIASPTINISSLNTFVNSKINGNSQKLFEVKSNKVFDSKGKGLVKLENGQDADSFLNNCQIISANLPIPLGDATGFTNLKFICYIVQGNNNYTTGVLNIGLPYSYDSDSDKYTYPVENLDLAEANPNEGSVYIAPSGSSISSLSDYKPDDNKKTKDITTLTAGAKWCSQGADEDSNYYNNASNAAYSFNPDQGDSTNWELPDLRIEFDGHYIQYSGLSSDLTRANANPPKTQMGANGFIDFPSYDGQPGGTNTDIDGGTATNYVATYSGHLYAVSQVFPSNSDLCNDASTTEGCSWGHNEAAPQSIYLQCIEGDTSCVANNGSLIFDNYVDLYYSAVGDYTDNSNYNFRLADYSAYKFGIKNHGYYLFDISGFNDWKNSTQTSTPYKAYSFDVSFLDGNTTNQVKNDIEILKSEHGNYRLAFVADGSGRNKGSLQIQQKNGDSWKVYNDASKYLPSTIKDNEALAGVSFQAGNLTLSYYDPSSSSNGGINLNATNSIAGQYKSHGYVWIADPYAYIDLQTDGNLVIHSSNSANAIGQLGVNKGTTTNPKQILWAANWYGNTGDWNSIQNPKLPSSDDSDKQKP
jgi:hypothetical protein